MSKELGLILLIGFFIGIILSACGLGVEDSEFWIWCVLLNIINVIFSKKLFKSDKSYK